MRAVILAAGKGVRLLPLTENRSKHMIPVGGRPLVLHLIDAFIQNGVKEFTIVVGYKGASPYDAGLFYCPYVPLQMVRAIDPDNYQPKVGFKTRYGMVSNPFAGGTNTSLAGAITTNTNVYYRKFQVLNVNQ